MSNTHILIQTTTEPAPSLDDTFAVSQLASAPELIWPGSDEYAARIKGGALWDDVVQAVQPHGLAVMHGSSPSVGVIGYLLGGGRSFYGRRHGPAINHVRAFEVVTPDGVVRRVDQDHHRDLFYALRGGGGGYAVVTAVEIGAAAVRGSHRWRDVLPRRGCVRAFAGVARLVPRSRTPRSELWIRQSSAHRASISSSRRTGRLHRLLVESSSWAATRSALAPCSATEQIIGARGQLKSCKVTSTMKQV